MNFLYTTPDEKFGTVAECSGTLVHVDNESSPALQALADNSAFLYPSIKFGNLTHSQADFTNTPAATECYYASCYQELKNRCLKQVEERCLAIEATPAYKYGKQLYDVLYSKLPRASDALLQHDLFQAKQEAGLFKCVAWHPHKEILAVAHQDDQVYLYEKKDSMWTCLVLSHSKMTQITCLEWKSKACGTLAVACKDGVCVWTLEQTIAEKQPRYHPSASMRYLTYPGQEYISSLAWDPTPGSHLLAVVSAFSNTLVIHDLLLNRTIPLKRYGSGNILLRWSPNGVWLFEGGSAGTSRMWDTRNWTSKKIQNPAGLWIQAACWSPDNRTLIYSMCGKSDIHALFLSGDLVKSDLVNVKIFSTSLTTVTTESGAQAEVGGVIRDISIDRRNGQRLAIIFENSNLIALYSVKQVSPLNLIEEPMLFPIGYMRGCSTSCSEGNSLQISALKGDTKPLGLSFSFTFKDGALLAITWDTGLITFVTHTFLTDEEIRKRIM
ncbi:WD40-repeat-containing domain protein [Parasitella parasitica]|nr:WD40-repeat-containing domain protein [Parasitella parasitica]